MTTSVFALIAIVSGWYALKVSTKPFRKKGNCGCGCGCCGVR